MSDELDPELQALLQAERTAPLPGAAEAKGAILAHVLAASAVTATSAAAAVSGTSASAAGAPTATTDLVAKTAQTAGQVATQTAGTVWTSKALILFALTTGGIGAAIGSGATFLALSETTPTPQAPTPQVPEHQTPRPVPALPAEVPAEEAPPNTTERTPAPENESGSEEPSTGTPQRAHQTHRAGMNTPPPTASSEQTNRDSSLAAERTLIDRAVAALRTGRAQDAMVALMAHERRFAQSSLAEERDLLSIEALVQQGREEQAQRRLQLFERRYPTSPRVARARALLRRSSP